MRILKVVNSYVIYDTPNLDCDSATANNHGWISIDNNIYWINGDLPLYVQKEIAKIAEERGLKFYFNNGSFFDLLKGKNEDSDI